MVAGLLVRSLRGAEGSISVPGLGAVIATFVSWNLIRREENGSGNPSWTLHASLSYQNEILMRNETMKRKITCIIRKDRTGKVVEKLEFCGYESLSLGGSSLILEGVVQCPK